MYRTVAGSGLFSSTVNIGKKAASVLPAAVAAAMITSVSAPNKAGIARSCASRREVHPFCHTQRWIRSSSRSKCRESELERGEFIIGLHCQF